MGTEGSAACGPQGGRASAQTQVPGDHSPSLPGPLDFGAVAFGEAPQSLHLPPEQVWHVGLPSPGCGVKGSR